MKKLLFTLLFIPFILNGQVYDLSDSPDTITDCSNLGIIDLSGRIYYDCVDSLQIGLIAYWSSQYENNADSLTFNSTADTIIYVSNDTVGLDDGQNYIIGNSMRFGDPNSGTIYTIIDTASTRDTVILDQNCTANIGDEFYISCIGTISDMSGNNFHASNSTGISQPRTYWYGTDSVSIQFDGNDDYLTHQDIAFTGSDSWSVSFWLNWFDYSTLTTFTFIAGEYDNASNSLLIRLSGNNKVGIRNTAGDYVATTNDSGDPLFQSGWHHVVVTADGSSLYLYIDNIYIDDGPGTTSMKFNEYGRGYTGTNFSLNGCMDDYRIYNRKLTPTNINQLYNEGRF